MSSAEINLRSDTGECLISSPKPVLSVKVPGSAISSSLTESIQPSSPARCSLSISPPSIPLPDIPSPGAPPDSLGAPPDSLIIFPTTSAFSEPRSTASPALSLGTVESGSLQLSTTSTVSAPTSLSSAVVVNRKLKPTAIVISSGSMKGIIQLGALFYLDMNGCLDNVTTYAGTSIGSLIAYLLIIGYSPLDVLTYINSHDISEGLEKIDFLSLISRYGVMSFDNIERHLVTLSMSKIGFLPTLEDLYTLFKKKLICVSFNKTKNETVYISYLTHPNMPAIAAIKASSSIPFVFGKFDYEGSSYIDGGCTDSFPVKFLDEIIPLGETIIGLNMKEERLNDSNILEYLFSVVCIPMWIIQKLRISACSDRCVIFQLDGHGMLPFQFKLDIKKKTDLFSSGFRQLKKAMEGEPVVCPECVQLQLHSEVAVHSVTETAIVSGENDKINLQ